MEPTWLGSLATWKHEPKDTPWARVLLIHGICEHSARHLNTVEALNQVGIEVIRFDLRGSGRSGGKRQFIQYWDDYIDDTLKVHHWICRTLPPLPTYLMGHSMGGAIALFFAHRYQKLFEGLILSAPAYITGGAISELKVRVGRLLSHLLPQLRIPSSSDHGAISRDASVVKAYWNDPLSFHFNTVRQGNEVLNALPKIPELCRDILIPTFIVHGTHDRIIRLEGSFEIIQNLRGLNKVLHITPGGYHEPHNDLDKEIYFYTLTKWIQSLPKTPKNAEKTTDTQKPPEAVPTAE